MNSPTRPNRDVDPSTRSLKRGKCQFGRMLLLVSLMVDISGCSAPVTAPEPVAVTPRPSRPSAAETLKELGFEPSEQGWLMNFAVQPILFESGVAALTSAEKAELRRIALMLLGAGIKGVRVEGHTDNSGSRQYNQTLSVRRAEAAAREFVDAGMANENVERVGYGFEKPIASNATAAGRAKNRRVVLIVNAITE